MARSRLKMRLAAFLGLIPFLLLFPFDWALSSDGREHRNRENNREVQMKQPGGIEGPQLSGLALRDVLLQSWSKSKPKAAYFILARNGDIDGIVGAMRDLEQRFNKRAQYPYIFVNNKPFSAEFQRRVGEATEAACMFGEVPKEHWNYPPHIDQAKAAASREELVKKGVPYGGVESYRFMCRYFSGFFFQHPLLDGFEYYWRVEPNVNFSCDILQDPFVYMQEHGINYGWNIVVGEEMATIPSLWNVTRDFIELHPESIAANNSWAGLMLGKGEGARYSGCHFWSNFEIGRLSFFRSETYRNYFKHLDRSGGFFYERWGDAPVHSFAAGLFLPRNRIHRFNNIGYIHAGWSHCPRQEEYRKYCDCNPDNDIDLARWPSLCVQLFKKIGLIQE